MALSIESVPHPYLEKAVHGGQRSSSGLEADFPRECVSSGLLGIELPVGTREGVPPEQHHAGQKALDHCGAKSHNGANNGPASLGTLFGEP